MLTAPALSHLGLSHTGHTLCPRNMGSCSMSIKKEVNGHMLPEIYPLIMLTTPKVSGEILS